MSNYNANNIKVLKGLEAVRKRPGMYIGSTDVQGLHHLVWEILDNSIDEVLGGFATEVDVTLLKNNGIKIVDNGRGIPVDYHKESKKSGVELVFTELHAGGKFGQNSAYKVSGGLNGVGASVVNAFSEKMEVIVSKDKKTYLTTFEKGGHILQKTHQIDIPYNRGTTIIFYPDFTFFDVKKFSYELIKGKLQESAFLNNDLKINLQSEFGHEKVTFQYKEGIKEFTSYVNEAKTVFNDPVVFSGSSNDIDVNLSFQYTDEYSENIISFVNNIKTKNGGTHETGFKTAWTKCFIEYAKNHGFLKKNISIEGSDIREGLTTIISIRIPEAILGFVGQTKDTLRTPQAKVALEQVVTKNLIKWLDLNKATTTKILNKIVSASKARMAARKARQEVRKLKSSSNYDSKLLAGKLTPAQSKNSNEIELFLVEGDSAGGSAKLGRNKKIQAILPLKGKVLNTEKSRLIDVLKNNEIMSIVATIGAGIGETFNLKNVSYNKIIIMTDADTDGAHIQSLILTFLFRYMKPLFDAKKVFVARPPLYMLKTSKREFYLWSDEELKRETRNLSNYTIQRYKGLGEMNASQLWETTMDPERRTLFRVLIEDGVIAEKRVSTLMGDKVDLRKKWINENVQFTLEDEFQSF